MSKRSEKKESKMLDNYKEVNNMDLMIPVKHYVCLRCKHTWQPRPHITEYPRACPKCHSIRWDKSNNQENGKN